MRKLASFTTFDQYKWHNGTYRGFPPKPFTGPQMVEGRSQEIASVLTAMTKRNQSKAKR